MRTATIGSGEIGGTVAALLASAGHEVAVSNSRGPESLTALVGAIGARAHAATVANAVTFAEVVFVAIPYGQYRQLPADRFAGRIVVDTTNYFAERDGELDDVERDETTSTELLAAFLPGARVVKGFNTLNYAVLRDERRSRGDPRRLAVVLAGDDRDALAVVAGLVDELGFEAVETGSLAEGGRAQQPGSPLFNQPMTSAEALTALGRIQATSASPDASSERT